MEFPLLCSHCRTINIVDLDSLEKRAWDKLRTAHGYCCQKCGTFNRMYFMTVSLQAAMEKLGRLNVKRSDFRYHFGKTLKKALGINNGPF